MDCYESLHLTKHVNIRMKCVCCWAVFFCLSDVLTKKKHAKHGKSALGKGPCSFSFAVEDLTDAGRENYWKPKKIAKAWGSNDIYGSMYMSYFTLFVNKSDEPKPRFFLQAENLRSKPTVVSNYMIGSKADLQRPSQGLQCCKCRKKWKKPIDVKKQKDTWQLSVIRQLGLIFLTLEGIFPLFLPRLTLQHAISAGSAWHVHTGTLCIGANPPCRPNLLVFWRSSETLNPHPCVTWCWPSQEWHSKPSPPVVHLTCLVTPCCKNELPRMWLAIVCWYAHTNAHLSLSRAACGWQVTAAAVNFVAQTKGHHHCHHGHT